MSPTGEHVNDVGDILTVGQTVDVRIREVRNFIYILSWFVSLRVSGPSNRENVARGVGV